MDPKTKIILDYFEQINQIPRCSKDEQQLAGWLATWAKNNGFNTKSDNAGNLVVDIPASKGFESAPTVILQGHMDMVCEKRPDTQHNFKTDPIRHIISGDWLHADGTSLGADNGIALALAMALVSDDSVRHPKLELLFTVDEETGLSGANQLDDKMITGHILINIDSEEEGVFTVGCAGGIDTKIELSINQIPVEEYDTLVRISVSGLCGGHSGIDINRGRANANKLLSRILSKALEQIKLRLISFIGGSAHNAIARDAEAFVTVKPDQLSSFKQIVANLEKKIEAEYAFVENELKIEVAVITDTSAQMNCADDVQTRKIVDLLTALPHGVNRMSVETPGLVDTSSNLATVSFLNKGLHILSSQRSVFTSRVEEISRQVASVARLAGASVKTDSAYPAWQPKMDSDLLKRCKDTYRNLFKSQPVVEIIHAGLECAVIGDKYPDMDMISIGPTMKNPHSPDECLYIPSIPKVWQFMAMLLASFTRRSHQTGS
jgi:dipeptidase D